MWPFCYNEAFSITLYMWSISSYFRSFCPSSEFYSRGAPSLLNANASFFDFFLYCKAVACFLEYLLQFSLHKPSSCYTNARKMHRLIRFIKIHHRFEHWFENKQTITGITGLTLCAYVNFHFSSFYSNCVPLLLLLLIFRSNNGHVNC